MRVFLLTLGLPFRVSLSSVTAPREVRALTNCIGLFMLISPRRFLSHPSTFSSPARIAGRSRSKAGTSTRIPRRAFRSRIGMSLRSRS